MQMVYLDCARPVSSEPGTAVLPIPSSLDDFLGASPRVPFIGPAPRKPIHLAAIVQMPGRVRCGPDEQRAEAETSLPNGAGFSHEGRLPVRIEAAGGFFWTNAFFGGANRSTGH